MSKATDCFFENHTHARYEDGTVAKKMPIRVEVHSEASPEMDESEDDTSTAGTSNRTSSKKRILVLLKAAEDEDGAKHAIPDPALSTLNVSRDLG